MQSKFLENIGLNETDALMKLNLTPLSGRRNMGMLGLIYKTVFGRILPHFKIHFHMKIKRFREGGDKVRPDSDKTINFRQYSIFAEKEKIINDIRNFMNHSLFAGFLLDLLNCRLFRLNCTWVIRIFFYIYYRSQLFNKFDIIPKMNTLQ